MARSNRKKRHSRHSILQSVFFIVLFLTAAYILVRSSIFEVREIRVSGNNILTEENIVSISGINPGENIFKLNLKETAQRFTGIPLIKSVNLSRRLPSTVEIRVVERRACALLPVDSGFIQVDDEGVCLQKGDIQVNQLPVITGIKADIPAPGERIQSETLISALAVVKELSAALLTQLSEINVSEDMAVAYTLDRIQCRFGTTDDIKQKGEVLEKLLNELNTKDKIIEYIDLSCKEAPVVKYVE